MAHRPLVVVLVFFNYVDELVVNFECDDIPFLFELKLLDFEKILGFCLFVLNVKSSTCRTKCIRKTTRVYTGMPYM